MKQLLLFSALLLLGLTQCQNERSAAPQFAEQEPPPPPDASAPAMGGESAADVVSDGANPESYSLDKIGNLKSKAAPAAAFRTSASTSGFADTSKIFVRTAQLKFRTPEALKATLAIEDIAARHQGFVTRNHLHQEQRGLKLTKVSPDSSLETIRYVVMNHLTIRVPNSMLDTTLRAIGRWAEYLDFRHVDAADVELDLMENELNRLRNQQLQAGSEQIANQNTT